MLGGGDIPLPIALGTPFPIQGHALLYDLLLVLRLRLDATGLMRHTQPSLRHGPTRQTAYYPHYLARLRSSPNRNVHPPHLVPSAHRIKLLLHSLRRQLPYSPPDLRRRHHLSNRTLRPRFRDAYLSRDLPQAFTSLLMPLLHLLSILPLVHHPLVDPQALDPLQDTPHTKTNNLRRHPRPRLRALRQRPREMPSTNAHIAKSVSIAQVA